MDLKIVMFSSNLAPAIAAFLLTSEMSVEGASHVSDERCRVDAPDLDRYPFLCGKSVTYVDPQSPIEQILGAVVDADVVLLGENLFSKMDQELRGQLRESGAVVVELPVYTRSSTPWSPPIESNGLLSAFGGQGLRQNSFEGGPVESPFPLALQVQGLLAALTVFAALYDGGGRKKFQLLTVEGAQAVTMLTSGALNTHTDAPRPVTNLGAAGRHPMYRQFRAGDGMWVAVGALGHRFERRFLEVLGLGSLLEDPRIDHDISRTIHPKNRNWVIDTISQRIAQLESTQVVELLRAAGIPVGVVRSLADWLEHPQVVANRLYTVAEKARCFRAALRSPVTLRATFDTDGWVQEQRQNSGLPLAGVRIVNLGVFLATPFAGALLAELGADVIKVEPPAGDVFRGSAYAFNRGMKSLAVDLASDAGAHLFTQVVASTDVVIDGLRPDVSEKLGITPAELRGAQPDVIHVSMSGYGGRGPLSQEPGVDMVIQAESGQMLAQGGRTPVANTIAINDVISGMLMAYGVTRALYTRRVSGRAMDLETSLAAASLFIQLLVTPEAAAPARHRRNGSGDLRGLTESQGYLRCADGWVYVDARENPNVTLPRDLPDQTRDDVIGILERQLVPAVDARYVPDVLSSQDLYADGILRLDVEEHGGRSFAMPGAISRVFGIENIGVHNPPGVGEHSQQILSTLGLLPERCAELSADGVVTFGAPMEKRVPAAYR